MNWRELNAVINDMTEEEVASALRREVEGEGRSTLVIRLHQRLCAMRMQRERESLLVELGSRRG